MNKQSNNPKPNNKRKSFYIILILLPFVVLLAAELLLRLVGFGREIPLFIESQQFQNYSQPNPDIIQRYFPNPAVVPDVSPDTEFFKTDKEPDSFRIVIQGGSTAAGFPYGRWGSIKGMLDQRFKRLYPHKKIEIINTAMSAVNSYTLLDFSDEIIQINPDLILIYAGHNEYLGIMGVGSAFASRGGRAATLMFLKFRTLRLYQLMESLFYSSQQIPKVDTKSKTLMSQIAKEKNIPFDSEMYHEGIEQFSSNLELLLNKYQQHKIPVLVATLVSNEKNQVPFSSVANTDWDDFSSQLSSLNVTSPELSELINLQRKQFKNSNSAEDAFKIARLLLKYQEPELARDFFNKARDYDQLRFRAPSKFNQIIKEQAEKNQAIVVDVESYFVENSENAIPGSELILEHLHPNSIGYFYLAEAFSDAIIKSDLLGKPQSVFSPELALGDIPISKSDKFYADFKISKLKSGYPFTTKTIHIANPKGDNLESIAASRRLNGENWLSLQQQLLIQYQKRNDFSEAAKIASLICDALPDQHHTAYIAGQLYFKVKDFQMAQYYHQLAINNSPENIQYLLALAQDYFTTGDLETSLSTLNKVLKINPQQKSAIYFSQKIKRQLSGNLK